MSIIAEKKKSDFPIAPAGNHVARCYSMIHLGHIEQDYGKGIEIANLVQITWELPNELHVFDEAKGEQPFVVSKDYTLSMHEKANLRKDLESWRGKAFTQEEAAAFDITVLLGIPCMLNIIHKTAVSSGNEYALVSGITAMPKGLEIPVQINENFEFNYGDHFHNLENLHDWIRDKVVTSKEYKEKVAPNEIEVKDEEIIPSGDNNQGTMSFDEQTESDVPF